MGCASFLKKKDVDNNVSQRIHGTAMYSYIYYKNQLKLAKHAVDRPMDLIGVYFRNSTLRDVPVSKWLGSPPFISHLSDLEGERTMVINHYYGRPWMILQVPVIKWSYNL